MSQRIGLIGLGNMGKPMCINILKRGYDLTVFDIRPEPMRGLESVGARVAKSPRDLSSQVNIIITMLPGPKEVEEVILGENGVIGGLKPDSVVIDMSTSSPILTKKISIKIQEKKCHMLDAPVSRGLPAAESGTLAVMVGGDISVFNECKALLGSMAKDITYIGTNGMGHAMKLVNQLISHTQLVSICEAFVLGTQAGIDPRTIFKVVSQASGDSFIFQYKAPRILKRDFVPGATVDILYKDLDLATEFGREMGVPLILTNVAREIYQAAKAVGLSRKDGTSIITLFETFAKCKIGEMII